MENSYYLIMKFFIIIKKRENISSGALAPDYVQEDVYPLLAQVLREGGYKVSPNSFEDGLLILYI